MDNLASELFEIICDLLPSGLGGGPSAFLSRPSLAVQVGALIFQYRQNKQMTQLALAQKMHVPLVREAFLRYVESGMYRKHLFSAL